MKVCFIGHRKVADTEQIKDRLHDTISMLIKNGADTFIFGSRSEFDTLCWEVVTELQAQYPHLKRISYNAPHETAFTSKEERESCEQFFSRIAKCEIHYTDYEKAVSSRLSTQKRNCHRLRLCQTEEKTNIQYIYQRNVIP